MYKIIKSHSEVSILKILSSFYWNSYRFENAFKISASCYIQDLLYYAFLNINFSSIE